MLLALVASVTGVGSSSSTFTVAVLGSPTFTKDRKAMWSSTVSVTSPSGSSVVSSSPPAVHNWKFLTPVSPTHTFHTPSRFVAM